MMTTIHRNPYLKIICFAIAGLTATLLTSEFSQSADAQSPPSKTFVYTESNIPTENGNTILGFEEDADGKLTPLPNSPFPAGGAGIADPTFTSLVNDNDQNVIVNPEHTRLFAVNSGSNTIAVFNIRRNGSLSPVKGSPFPSGGVDPVSLGLADDVLYVVNKNLDRNDPNQDAKGSQPNYTAFNITQTGQLIPIPESTVSIPNGSSPSQALISRDKKFLFGAETATGLVRSFKILPRGGLQESPNSPILVPPSEFPPGFPPQSLGLQVHPKLPILYVGFVTAAKIGVYNYNPATGELTFVKAVPNSGFLPCWLITNRKGTRLYTGNSGDNSISVYDLADPRTPKEIQKVTLRGVGSAVNLSLNSQESLLQVVVERNSPDTNEGNAVNVLKVNPTDGTLTEVDTSPLPLPSVESSFLQGNAVVSKVRRD